MKKLILTLALSLLTVSAFASGGSSGGGVGGDLFPTNPIDKAQTK